MTQSTTSGTGWIARVGARLAAGFPLVVLIAGFGFSAAINIMATWPAPELVLGGIMASLALPAAIHLWPMVPAGDSGVRGWLQWFARNAAMTGIAGMAAYITFRHGAAIMTPDGVTDPWDLATGYLYTLITESLVVLGVMAHRAKSGASIGAARPQTERATPVQVVVEPVPAPAPVAPPITVADVVKPPVPSSVGTSGRRPNADPVSFGTKSLLRDKVREKYRNAAFKILDAGGSLDSLVLADVDREAGASLGYAKKHAAAWRAEIEDERSTEKVS